MDDCERFGEGCWLLWKFATAVSTDPSPTAICGRSANRRCCWVSVLPGRAHCVWVLRFHGQVARTCSVGFMLVFGNLDWAVQFAVALQRSVPIHLPSSAFRLLLTLTLTPLLTVTPTLLLTLRLMLMLMLPTEADPHARVHTYTHVHVFSDTLVRKWYRATHRPTQSTRRAHADTQGHRPPTERCPAQGCALFVTVHTNACLGGRMHSHAPLCLVHKLLTQLSASTAQNSTLLISCVR